MKTLAEKKQRYEELSKGKTLIKSDYEKAYQAIDSKNAKEIKGMVSHLFNKQYISELHTTFGDTAIDMSANFIGIDLVQAISKNANDFTKDIAENIISKEVNPSEKQAWRLAYQIVNNKQVYLNEIIDAWDIATLKGSIDTVNSIMEKYGYEIDEDADEMARLGYEIFLTTL